jgi:hypothetical protein
VETTTGLRDPRAWVLGLFFIALAAAMVLLPPIATPAHLVVYADRREFFGVPNFFDVVSNLPFVLIGAWGVHAVARKSGSAFGTAAEKRPYGVFFASVALAGIGSMYYHLAPDAARLVWDRLPIAVGIMALLSAVIAERISLKAGLYLLGPLAFAGAAAVLFWRWTLLRASENVLPYAVVQYGAGAAVVLIALLFRSRYTHGAYIFGAAALYAAAKVAEVLDAAIYALGGVVSGHTLKHLLAALAAWWLLRMIQSRRENGVRATFPGRRRAPAPR